MVTAPPTVQNVETAMVRYLNTARRKHGLPVLRRAAALVRAARGHSRAMLRSGELAHGDFVARLRAAGWTRMPMGETIGYCNNLQAAAKWVVRAWLQSAPHRHILLDGRLRYVGVGVAVGDLIYTTADFGG